MKKLDFIKSRRFWGLIVIALISVLQAEGIIGLDITNAIKVIIMGFIGIRTIDKAFIGR